MRHGLCVLVCLHAFAAVLPARGQTALQGKSPAAGRYLSLRMLRDSLAQLQGMPALPGVPTDNTNADAFLRRGFIALRRLELGYAWADFDTARASFARAQRLNPIDPWPLYGRALTLLLAPENRPKPGAIIIFQTFRRDSGNANAEVHRSLIGALERDPAFGPAAVLLAEVALDLRSPAYLEEARSALARLDSLGGADAPALVALALVREAQEPLEDPTEQVRWAVVPAAAQQRMREAESAARRAIALDSGSVLARYALALSLLRQPGQEEDGAREYFAGLDVADSAGAEPYEQDIRVYVGREGVNSLRAAEADERRVRLRRFWQGRAASAAVTVPERLATHYRRLAVARARYLSRDANRAMFNAVSWMGDAEQELDARGRVYVRWGEPDAVSGTERQPAPCPGCPEDVRVYAQAFTWFYYGVGKRPLAFHFIGDGRKYLMDVLQCPPESSQGSGGFRPETYFTYRRYVSDVLDRMPDLRPFWGACGAGSGREKFVADWQHEMATDEAWGITHERGSPVYPEPIPEVHDLATFSGPGGRTTLVAIVAVPVLGLEPENTEARLRFDLRATLLAADTAAGWTRSIPLRRTFTTGDSMAGDGTFRFAIQLDAEPAPDAIYRLRLEQVGTERGAAVGAQIAIPDYAAPHPGMSDVLLGDLVGPGVLHRAGVTLAANPSAAFSGGRFVVYYELYNLPPGSRYATEILVQPVATGALSLLPGARRTGRTVRLAFSGIANPGGLQPERRELATRLSPGRYRLTVRVRPANGALLERSREFVVR